MGTALSSHTPTSVVSIDAYVAELLEFTYTGDMGRARFLKTVKALHREGEVVVKVFIKPTLAIELSEPIAILQAYQKSLDSIPNAIGYARILENDRAGYLIRQHIKHNLYDRMSTRPFLEDVEKLWVIFQLLHVLKDAHSHHVFHGDIKAENVLVSSWKWVYLADWAPFKPVTLPETDSSNFLFYFNTSSRRVCYVAPERFTTTDTEGPTSLNAAMDIYSMGCVFAELIMEKPLFSLADSFKYKRGELEPQLEISNKQMNEMIQGMISIEPKYRKTAQEYLDQYRGTLFPEYFWQLYTLMSPFSHSRQNESSKMLNHIYDKFDDILSILSIDVGPPQKPADVFPVLVATNTRCWEPKKSETHEGALIILATVCSQMVSTVDNSSRQRALNLLLALSAFVPDEIKLNRSLPYFTSLLKDPVDSVQIAAISSLTQLMAITSELSNLNERVFTEYLLPRIRNSILLPSASSRVKAVYAACLPHLAKAAYELETASKETLNLHIESHARSLLTEKSSLVRRQVLNNFDELCVRMGRHSTNDIFLSHAITFLNDHDIQVRKDFFSFVSRIGPLVGPGSLEEYVIPLMLQSLTDHRESVVSVVISSLAALIGLGLVRQKVIWTILPQMAKFFIHPNVYLRTETSILFAASAKWLSTAQIYCLFRPIIEQVVQGEISDYTDYRCYIAAIKPPITVPVYNLMLKWAAESKNSSFISPVENDNIVFSQEDKRWMERLREVGFNNEELWRLVMYKQYMHQITRPTKMDSHDERVLKVLPHTWNDGEIPVGLERYITGKLAQNRALSTNLEQDFTELQLGIKVETPELPPGEPVYAGTLVTSAKAHRGAITALGHCDSQVYFVTGADDKLIKVWDTKSVRNGTPRQIHTHDFKSPVKSIEFFHGRSAFVVGTEDGKIHLLELDYSFADNVLSYGPLQVKPYQTLEPGYAVAIKHVKGDLYILKSDCTVEKLNLVTQKSSKWQNPVEHGPPTCWCFDRDFEWVAIGTTHGIIDVWHLRFNLLVQSWGIGTLQPINCLELHPRTPHWIIAGGGFDREIISTWNVQNCKCFEVLMPSSEEDLPNLDPITGNVLVERLASRNVKDSFNIARAMTAIKVSNDSVKGSQYLLSGGTDFIIRFWDLQSPQKCKVISGLPHDHPGVTYSSRVGSSVRLTTEKISAVKTKPPRKARVSVIQLEELDIGRNHRGTIMHVNVLATKDQMLIVSADQVGYLKVYI